jgi:hypothetical protein
VEELVTRTHSSTLSSDTTKATAIALCTPETRGQSGIVKSALIFLLFLDFKDKFKKILGGKEENSVDETALEMSPDKRILHAEGRKRKIEKKL